nr:MAG TPA: hypothetical protein [Caudoviricetes sp.]
MLNCQCSIVNFGTQTKPLHNYLGVFVIIY